MQDDMQCNAALYPRKTLNAYWRKNLENIRAAWLGLGRVVVDGIGNNFMKEKPVWVFFFEFQRQVYRQNDVRCIDLLQKFGPSRL